MSDRRLRYFEFWRRDPRRDVDDEIEFHLEARIADLVARGLPLDDARRRATAEFGDARAVREQTVEIDQRMMRRGRRADWLADVLRDARVGLRSLRRTPAFAVTAVLCAALAARLLVNPGPAPRRPRQVASLGDDLASALPVVSDIRDDKQHADDLEEGGDAVGVLDPRNNRQDL